MKMNWQSRYLLLSASILLASPAMKAHSATLEPAPSGMLCDLLSTPERTLITNPKPRFSWIVNATGNDEVQTAYEIQVAHSVGDLDRGQNLLWNSGTIRSDQSTSVAYDGPSLESNREYYWRVRSYLRDAKVSVWSVPQHIRTGTVTSTRVIGDGVERLPMAQTEVAPVRIEKIAANHYFIDFGRDGFAGLRLTLTSAAPGTKVTVHMGEALTGTNAVDRKPPGSVRYHLAELTLDSGTHAYIVPLTAKDLRRMPPEIGAVMPFRYVEIEGYAGPLTPDSARQIVAHYEFDEIAASFDSSSKDLNDVWDLCRYSMKATSFCGIFVDGDRERLPYEADAYLNQLGWYASTRDLTLPRYSAEHLIRNATWPTEWILYSVLMGWNDYLYTGDSESLKLCYNDLKAKSLTDLAGDDGLIRTEDPAVPASVISAVHAPRMQDIVDWPQAERDGYEMRPVNTVVNAFYYRALENMAKIATATEHADDARAYTERAAKVYAAFNDKFFDAQTGLYIDGRGSKAPYVGDVSTHSSLHANMFALAFSLVPAERVAKVAAFVKSRGMACSVYGAQFLMEALYAADQGTYAQDLMLAPGDRSWRHMAHDTGTTITMEAWDQKYKRNQDWNHAWGAAPANVIPRLLMGVEPTEPGFSHFRIRPQPGSLSHASIDIPSVRGTIHAAFTQSDDKFILNVQIPANTRAEIDLPKPANGATNITIDGKPKSGKSDGDWLIIPNVGSGKHSFAVSK